MVASPLDVPSVKVNMTTEKLVHIIRNGRERENCRIHPSVSRDSLEGLLSDLDEDDFGDFLESCQNREQDWFGGRGHEI